MVINARQSAGGNRKPKPLITQAELREYVEQAKIVQRHNDLRKSITERLEQGVPVEAGELTPAIEPDSVRRWSIKGVGAVLGSKEARELWNQLQPIVYRRLLIQDQDGEDLAWKAHRRANPALATQPPDSQAEVAW